jgi:hypothetical protein
MIKIIKPDILRKNITDDFCLFEEKINEYIIDMTETYFFLNADDELEW